MPTIVDCQPWTDEVPVTALSELLDRAFTKDAGAPDLKKNRRWFVPASVDQAELDACMELLSDAERSRMDRFRHEGARQQFIVGHGVIHLLLKKYLKDEYSNLYWQETAHHKPFIQLPDASRPLEYNLSHCEGFIAVAFGRHSQGIDIEKVRHLDDLEGICRQVFTDSEIEQVFATKDPERQSHTFFKFWTCKEAALKADGTGFMKDPKSLQLNFDSKENSAAETTHWSDSISGYHAAWTQRA